MVIVNWHGVEFDLDVRSVSGPGLSGREIVGCEHEMIDADEWASYSSLDPGDWLEEAGPGVQELEQAAYDLAAGTADDARADAADDDYRRCGFDD